MAVCGLCFLTAAAAAEEGVARLAIFDTGASSAEPLKVEALASQQGWTKVAAGDLAYAFKGDAVLTSSKMLLVFRRNAPGAELYGKNAENVKGFGRLVPLGSGPATALSVVKIKANDKGSAVLEATYKTADGKDATVAFGLTPGAVIVKTEPLAGATGLRLESPSRLGVLPDFFADDMVVDARDIPIAKTELPSDNFFMQMLDNGNAIVTAIWDKSKKDIELTFAGEGEARMISGVDIQYGEGGSIWAAVLAQKGLWAQAEITPANVKKLTPLDWTIPFQAKWKGNFMQADHTVQSWDLVYGGTGAHGWSGVVGGYVQPFGTAAKEMQKAGIQPPSAFSKVPVQGPFVVYPSDRTAETPLDTCTITDLMRDSLGAGPCKNLLEGQGDTSKGIYTCSLEHTLPPLFEFGLQKYEKAYINKMLDEVQVFVKAIQDRINVYVDFRGELLKYLAEQKKAKPEMTEFISKLETQTSAIQEKKANGAEPVKKLVEQLRPAITQDALKVNCHQIAAAIAGIGLGQDNAVAKCRLSVKVLRQLATIEMAINPKNAAIANEVRKRTQAVLRNPLGHEMH
jgi:hypothetical protein